MDDIAWDSDDPFADQRERVDDPMRRLFSEYGLRYRSSVLIGIIASVFARLLDLIPPVLLGIAVDAIFLQTIPFELPLIPSDWLAELSQGEQFLVVVFIIAASFLIGAAFHWIRNWGFNAFAQDIQHDIRTDTYDRMQRLDMEFFADKQTGEMMSVLSNDVNQLERFLNDGLNSAFRLGVMVIGIALILFWLNPQLALISLAPVPLIAVFTYLFIKRIQPKYAAVRSSVGKVNSRLENNLGGIQVIKSSNTEDFESNRVEDVSELYYDTNWGAIRIRIKFFPGLQIIAGIGFVLTFLVGGYWVFDGPPGPFTGTLHPGAFVTFILLTQQLVWPMAQFGQIVNMYQRAAASAERIFGLMDQRSRIRESNPEVNLEISEGTVEYDNVAFGYDDESVLRDIDFRVDGGQTIALVGPTGSGKTTLLKLLLRLYDVRSGRITIDGQDIREVSISSIRRQIGYVGQESFLFYGTVEDNLTYGSFEATEEEMIAAAKAAEAHEFIVNLPDGYQTMVGERGVKLSGGQRQRLCIARAILKDPEILILDEATSDVDTETEMLIQRSLAELTADRTTFAIAHRLSTIKDADIIIVLENGQIVEQGTHGQLINQGGLYSHFWRVQAGEIDDLPEEFIRRASERQAQPEPDL